MAISIDGLNEETFIKAIGDLNKILEKGHSYRTLSARKKFDMKHKLFMTAGQYSVNIDFRKNGEDLLRYTRRTTGDVEYWALSHKAKNPNYSKGGDNWRDPEFTSYCSREEFYDYMMAHPPFFEWLLWNQL